jgi:hypothetical protein
MALETDLIHYWKLDDNGNDSKGSYDLTKTNGSYVSAKINNGFKVTTSGEYLERTGVSDTTDVKTISYWIYHNESTLSTSVRAIFRIKGAGSYPHYYTGIGRKRDTNSSTIYITSYNGSLSGDDYTYTEASLSAQNWHHVVITWNSSNSQYDIYIDGSSVSTSPSDYDNDHCPLWSDWDIVKIIDTNTVDSEIIVDELGVWSRSLSSSEVLDLYNSGSGKTYDSSSNSFVSGGSSGGGTSSNLNNGLVSYYKFDGDANDSVGSNDGTVSGATQTSSGKINQAYSFDGNNDYITYGDILNSTFITNTFSISCWVYITDYTDGDGYHGMIINKWHTSDSSDNAFILYCDGSWNTNGADTAFTQPSLNTWHHIVVTMDGGTAKIYLDGSLDATGTGHDCNTTTYPLRIGNLWNNAYDFTGTIDEVGIWSRALTSQEVSELYNSGAGLSYPFTGGDISNTNFFTLTMGAEF